MSPEIIPHDDKSDRKSLRLFRPSLVLLCGPAGCGKSTFAERHFRPTQIISSDWARGRISDDERDQRYNTPAFALVHFLVEQRLTVNRLCVVDSTALTAVSRKDFLELGRKLQVPTTVILFHVPLETCIERDTKRERSVGRSIVERQYHSYEQTQGTIRQEGFDQIVELQDADLEHVQIEVLFRPVTRPAPGRQQAEAGATRGFERPNRPSRPQPPRPGNNRPPFTNKPAPHPAPASPTPRAAPGQVSAAPPKTVAPPPAETHPSVAGVPSPQAAAPPRPPATNEKPVRPAGPVEPAPANAAPPPPAETENRKLDK